MKIVIEGERVKLKMRGEWSHGDGSEEDVETAINAASGKSGRLEREIAAGERGGGRNG